jgi:excisionase family DNA binding protein
LSYTRRLHTQRETRRIAMTDVSDYLRAADIARLTGVSLRTVRRWIAEGILPSVRVGGVRLAPKKDVVQMLTPAPPPWSDTEEEMQG